MTIPRIQPYALPCRSELPQNRLAVNFDPAYAALLIHDTQQYFLDFFGDNNVTSTRVLENAVALREACRKQGIPTVYTAQPPVQSLEQRGLLQEMWGPGITAYPERTGLCDQLAPRDTDLVLTKWRYSAFARTPLLSWLRDNKRTQLIICGVYAHIGCQCTAADAFMSDITPILVSDAIADFSRAKHLGALEYVAGCCGLVFDTEYMLSSLGAAQASVAGSGRDGIDNELRADLALLLEVNVEELLPDASLFDVGLDSVRLMTLVERWRGKGYAADLMDLAETPTIAAWATKFKRVSAAL